MLAKIVSLKDLDVDTARDGNEAIDRIDRDGYDVILLDLMMPRTDGFAVLDHLLRTQPHQLRRTIVASAIPKSEVSRRLEAPVYSIHNKPFDVRALMTDIDACSQTDQARVPY